MLQEESVEESMLKRKSIEIAKNRYAGDLGEMPLHFTKPILSFSKAAGERYRNSIKLTELGSTTKVGEDFDNDESYWSSASSTKIGAIHQSYTLLAVRHDYSLINLFTI